MRVEPSEMDDYIERQQHQRWPPCTCGPYQGTAKGASYGRGSRQPRLVSYRQRHGPTNRDELAGMDAYSQLTLGSREVSALAEADCSHGC